MKWPYFSYQLRYCCRLAVFASSILRSVHLFVQLLCWKVFCNFINCFVKRIVSEKVSNFSIISFSFQKSRREHSWWTLYCCVFEKEQNTSDKLLLFVTDTRSLRLGKLIKNPPSTAPFYNHPPNGSSVGCKCYAISMVLQNAQFQHSLNRSHTKCNFLDDGAQTMIKSIHCVCLRSQFIQPSLIRIGCRQSMHMGCYEVNLTILHDNIAVIQTCIPHIVPDTTMVAVATCTCTSAAIKCSPKTYK